MAGKPLSWEKHSFSECEKIYWNEGGPRWGWLATQQTVSRFSSLKTWWYKPLLRKKKAVNGTDSIGIERAWQIRQASWPLSSTPIWPWCCTWLSQSAQTTRLWAASSCRWVIVTTRHDKYSVSNKAEIILFLCICRFVCMNLSAKLHFFTESHTFMP